MLSKDSSTGWLTRPSRSHLRAHLHRYGVVPEDLLRPAKAAAFPLHDEIPKGVRGSIDEVRSLRVASIGCQFAATCSPVKGVQRIERAPQFPGKAADCRRLLLTDLIFKDVLSCSQADHDDPVGDLMPGGHAMD
jgi:hypothetical protein